MYALQANKICSAQYIPTADYVNTQGTCNANRFFSYITDRHFENFHSENNLPKYFMSSSDNANKTKPEGQTFLTQHGCVIYGRDEMSENAENALTDK